MRAARVIAPATSSAYCRGAASGGSWRSDFSCDESTSLLRFPPGGLDLWVVVWRFQRSGSPHPVERGDCALTAHARYPAPRPGSVTSARFRGAHLELEFRLLGPPVDAASRSDVDPPGGMFGGGALCGSSFLERLLRRLLSKLPGFLRALHLRPSWSLVWPPFVHMTREPRRVRIEARGPAATARGVRTHRVSHGSHTHVPAGTTFATRVGDRRTPRFPCRACIAVRDCGRDSARSHEPGPGRSPGCRFDAWHRSRNDGKTASQEARPARLGGGQANVSRRKSCLFCKDKVREVDYKNVEQLRRYTSDRGKIRSRRMSGACRRHQRQLAVAIKRAREMGLLPLCGGRGRAAPTVAIRRAPLTGCRRRSTLDPSHQYHRLRHPEGQVASLHGVGHPPGRVGPDHAVHPTALDLPLSMKLQSEFDGGTRSRPRGRRPRCPRAPCVVSSCARR